MTKRVLIAGILSTLFAVAPGVHAEIPAGAVGESVSRHITAIAPFQWDVSYDQYFDGANVVTAVDVLFAFPLQLGYSDAQKAAFVTQAEQEIEFLWNDNFVIRDVANNRSFGLRIDLVPATISNFDQAVEIAKRPASCGATSADLACRDNMIRWFDDALPATKAHEFGHMLGLLDEYPGGAVAPGPNPTVTDDGVMGFGALSDTPVFYSRYYQSYLGFMNQFGPDDAANPGGGISFSDYQQLLGGNPNMPSFVLVAVPEPGAWALMGAGVVVLLVARRRATAV